MVRHEDDIESVQMAGEGVKDVTKKIMIGPRDGYAGYLRVFTVQVGGHTPHHAHDWFHANYILAGTGTIFMEGEQIPVRPGSVAYIEGGKKHHFENTGREPLKFICLVPTEGDKY